jgi:hypothetical protein
MQNDCAAPERHMLMFVQMDLLHLSQAIHRSAAKKGTLDKAQPMYVLHSTMLRHVMSKLDSRAIAVPAI